MKYLWTRLKEPGTWRALALVFTAPTIAAPAAWQAYMAGGVMACGAIAALLPEPGSQPLAARRDDTRTVLAEAGIATAPQEGGTKA